MRDTPFDIKNRQDITQIQKKLLDTIGSEALNILMQGLSEDIFSLSQSLASKQNTISGYTGTISIVTNVDFASETIVSKTINISNGIIESITNV